MFFSIGPNSRLDRPINVNGSPFRTGLVACLLVASAVYAFANPATAANGEPQDITDSDPQAAAAKEAELLSNTRQLTFEGRRAGEGYFSRDGSQLVFQSEREPGNPFFQYLPTDAKSFYIQGVPVLSAFTGSHAEYHTPRDTPNRLNYEGAASVARLMGLITRSVAMRPSPPDYIRHEATQRETRGPLRAYLGTIPDYAEEVQGVLLGGTSKNGPADKAGVKSGDIIVGGAYRVQSST